MKKITLLILAFVMFMTFSCEKDEDSEDIYMGTAYIGQSIPVDTKYSYSEGTYSAWISFIDQSSYNWGQADVQGEMPAMIVPCEYNSTTGEFSDSMAVTFDGNTYGATKYFPTSFCIDNSNKLYLITFDSQKDTNLIFPRTIAEKLSGSEGNIEGAYKSSLKTNNWFSNADDLAESKIEAEVNYTYGAGTFSGTLTARFIDESTLSLPEWGIEIGSSDITETINFSGTWEYNKTNNTISETLTSPIDSSYTYTPYWVSYNDKLYMITSLTRFYQKEDN